MSRISPGTVIVGIFAVLFGLVGAYAVRNSLQTPPPAEPAAPVLNAVPIASLDLQPGREITMGDIAILRLSTEQIQEQGLPDGYMTNSQQIIGRTLKEPLAKGKPFFTDQLYPEGVGPTISSRLRPGFRAVTVEIANEAAVAGLAPPGSFVDVFFRTTQDKTPDLPETTVTLLENVEVLALGPNVVPGIPAATARSFAGNVTLAVSPEQASALKVVEGRGELMLALRGPDDEDLPTEIGPETLEGLLGVVVEPTEAPTQTTIYRGVANQTVLFQPEASSSPVRITARPIRARSTPASDADPVLPPTTQDAPPAAAEPDPADSPTSSLEPAPSSITQTPPQVVTRIVPRRREPRMRSQPEVTAAPSATVAEAAQPPALRTPEPQASQPTIRSKMISSKTTPVPPAETPPPASSIRAQMATSNLPTRTSAANQLSAAPVASVSPAPSPRAVAAHPPAPIPAEPTPALVKAATPEPPAAAISQPRPVPVAADQPSTPIAASASPAKPVEQYRGKSFRSTFYAGTEGEERVYENGQLASRTPVSSPTETTNSSDE